MARLPRAVVGSAGIQKGGRDLKAVWHWGTRAGGGLGGWLDVMVSEGFRITKTPWFCGPRGTFLRPPSSRREFTIHTWALWCPQAHPGSAGTESGLEHPFPAFPEVGAAQPCPAPPCPTTLPWASPALAALCWLNPGISVWF